MKIDDPGSKPATLQNVHVGNARSGDTLRASDKAITPQTDKVSLSGTLQALASPQQAPVELTRVERIRASIADGSFRADASGIADGLIASARTLAPARS